jgi:hypothetical protein
MLVPPLVYAGWTLVHGPLSGFWPYPFIDLPKIGWPHFLRNVAEFIVFFSLVGSIYALIDRVIGHLRLRLLS